MRWVWWGLAPGPWRWRQRLGMLECRELVQRAVGDAAFDAVLCTSLLPAAEFRGLMPMGLRDKPLILLMHENQVAYPDGAIGAEPRDLHAAVTDFTALAAADAVIWTSAWNQRSCMAGLHSLLTKANTSLDVAGELARIEACSHVCWPPVEDPLLEHAEHNFNNYGRSNFGTSRALVAWPHRHQHDKGPDLLLEAAEHAADTGVPLDWALLGERRGASPPSLEAFRGCFGRNIRIDGHLERPAYLGWLRAADWVCSTARHEYFGIAVVEGMLSGCLPWLPARLSYPELVPAELLLLRPTAGGIDEGLREQARTALRAHLQPALAPQATSAIEAVVLSVL